MSIARRPVLAGLALAMLGGPALATGVPQEKTGLFGMVGKIKSLPGKRTELIAALTGGSSEMPGCVAYSVAEDVKDDDGIWVWEVWESKASHAASLDLPQVKNAIRVGRPLIAAFEISADTRPMMHRTTETVEIIDPEK